MTEAIRAGAVVRLAVLAGARRTEGLRALLEEADRRRVPISWVDSPELEALGGRENQGVAAVVRPPPELDERTFAQGDVPEDALIVVLDGIMDPQNLGACARSAEAAGAWALVTRERRAAAVTPSALRASAGALFHLRVARVTNLTRTIEALKDRGVFVVGLDDAAKATIADAAPPARPLALVVGAEGQGISRLVREACDLLLSIPMAGRVGSLNASAALAVALFGYALRAPGP